MRNVTIGDLENPNRLAMLFVDAERRGLVKRCEADQLAFFAGAERAKRVATRNVAGCFVHIVRHGCFGFVAQQDEDAARAKILALRELGQELDVLATQSSGLGTCTQEEVLRRRTSATLAVESALATCKGVDLIRLTDTVMSGSDFAGFDPASSAVTIFSITERKVSHRSGLLSHSPAPQSSKSHPGLQGLDT